MAEQDSENTDNLSRRDVLQTVVGTGIAGAAGLTASTNTAAAAPDYYVRYWPIDTDVGSCTSASGKVRPGTGPVLLTGSTGVGAATYAAATRPIQRFLE